MIGGPIQFHARWRAPRRHSVATAFAAGVLGALAVVATGCGGGEDAGERADGTDPDAGANPAVDEELAELAEDAPMEIGEDVLALASEPNRDLSLIDPMVRLNAVHFGIEPFIRDRSRYEEIAQAAEAIVAICDEEPFVRYTSRPDFERAPERFEAMHALLRQGALDAAAAARSGDAEGLFDAYTRMDVSCTGCHKRYAPLE